MIFRWSWKEQSGRFRRAGLICLISGPVGGSVNTEKNFSVLQKSKNFLNSRATTTSSRWTLLSGVSTQIVQLCYIFTGLIKVYNSSVGIALGYGLGSFPVRGKSFFSISLRSDRLWGQPNFLHNEYCWLFPLRQSVRSLKLTVIST